MQSKAHGTSHENNIMQATQTIVRFYSLFVRIVTFLDNFIPSHNLGIVLPCHNGLVFRHERLLLLLLLLLKQLGLLLGAGFLFLT